MEPWLHLSSGLVRGHGTSNGTLYFTSRPPPCKRSQVHIPAGGCLEQTDFMYLLNNMYSITKSLDPALALCPIQPFRKMNIPNFLLALSLALGLPLILRVKIAPPCFFSSPFRLFFFSPKVPVVLLAL